MGLFSLFGGGGADEDFSAVRKPFDPQWQASSRGYYRMLSVGSEGPDLTNIGGVFIVWHRGERPAWVYVGQSKNLGEEFEDILKNNEIMQYHKHGGLYVTWSQVLEQYRDGVVRYLVDTLQPVAGNGAYRTNANSIPVLVPG